MEVITNGTIINEGKAQRGYIAIDGQLITAVGFGDAPHSLTDEASVVTDVDGDYIIPGVIDDHVHFRDPGLTHKADIETESRAAVAGGITSYMDMPNTKPATVTMQDLQAKMERAASVSAANYSFYIGATATNIDTLKSLDYSHVCGVKVFMGSSTGGMLVNDAEALRRIFSEVPAIVAVHSEDEDTIRANRELYTSQLGTDDLPLRYHPLVRSEQACYDCTSRAVRLARECGTRLHVLHVSTARELELFEPGDVAGKQITAEACLNYLLYSDEDYERMGTRIKCNPAIKTAADRDALRRALIDGRLDVVGTDHAPHLLSEKQGGALKAASGVPLAQFSLLAMLELAYKGVFTQSMVIDKMCHAPATLFGIDRRGYLRPGYWADVVIVHQVPEGYTVSDNDVLSRCCWTPFAGTTFHHSVRRTIVNGHTAYDNGKLSNEIHSMQLLFRH